MAASQETVARVLEVIEKYVPRCRIIPMLKEIARIGGNKSFTDTIELLGQAAVESNAAWADRNRRVL